MNKPPPKAAKPQIIYLETTRECNLDCPGCMTRGGAPASRPAMSTSLIMERVLLPARRLGAGHLIFSGGEFLLRDDAYLLLGEAHRMGFKVRVASNGTTLGPARLRDLKRILGSNLVVSLGVNSFGPINSDTRCRAGGDMLELIGRLKAARVRVQLIVTVSKDNAPGFADTVATIKRLGLPFNRSPYVPRGGLDPSPMLDAETMRRWVHPVLTASPAGYVSFTPMFLNPDQYWAHAYEARNGQRFPGSPTVGCWCGSWLAVSPEGEVACCPLLLDGVSNGNLLQRPLEEIVAGRGYREFVSREKLGGRCGDCRYRFTCGGCRALAFYHSGDALAEDPTCFLAGLPEADLARAERDTARSFARYARAARLGGFHAAGDPS